MIQTDKFQLSHLTIATSSHPASSAISTCSPAHLPPPSHHPATPRPPPCTLSSSSCLSTVLPVRMRGGARLPRDRLGGNNSSYRPVFTAVHWFGTFRSKQNTWQQSCCGLFISKGHTLVYKAGAMLCSWALGQASNIAWIHQPSAKNLVLSDCQTSIGTCI